jgi:hypothetical protein
VGINAPGVRTSLGPFQHPSIAHSDKEINRESGRNCATEKREMPCAKHCANPPTISIAEFETRLGSKVQWAWSIDCAPNLAKALRFACAWLEVAENVG